MTMNCRKFEEIADTYLSGELLVETNHSILGHLENCADCRDLLGARREFRLRLREAVVRSAISQVDPAAATRIRARLRDEAMPRRPLFSSFRLAFAGVSALVLISIVGFVVFQYPGDPAQLASVAPPPLSVSKEAFDDGPRAIPASLMQTTEPAVEDHKHCAIMHNLKERPISLDEASKEVDPVNTGFDEAVMSGVKSDPVESCELVKAHYCVFNGVRFTHIILERGGKLVSVLITKADEKGPEDVAPLNCQKYDGFETACFKSKGYAVFVVSELGKSELLNFAKNLYVPVGEHLALYRKSI